MATILNFPALNGKDRDLKDVSVNTSVKKEAEIIIFSGVRIERLENQPHTLANSNASTKNSNNNFN